MPNPLEIAVLTVNGKEFKDWQTVMVQHRYADGFHIFQFTSVEKLGEFTGPQQPLAWQTFLNQFKPGDLCTIKLAGILALTGEITQRQSAYDSDSKGVQLIGKSLNHTASKSSVVSKTGKYDGYSWSKVARSLLGEIGLELEPVGILDETPFENLQIPPGKLIFATLEELARNKGIILGTSPSGNMQALGDDEAKVLGALVEGVNILRANATFSNEFIHSRYLVDGQIHGNDSRWGATASEIRMQVPGSAKRISPLLVPIEQPGTASEAGRRARFEAQWHEGTEVKATIVTIGWLNPQTKDLWRIGTAVWVRSPMLPLDLPLVIQNATFTQSNETGTITSLDLVLPWYLNKHTVLAGPAAGPGRPRAATPENRVCFMHRMDPRSTAFRAYHTTARGVLNEADDNHNLQEVSGRGMNSEEREKIERPQNYGFTSVFLKADKDKDGKIKEAAEVFYSFISGSRSHPIAAMIDDRRHRPYGLKPGENAQYDDAHQMTYIARKAIYVLSRDSKDKDGKEVKRFASLRHVEKKDQERKKGQQQQGGQQQQTQQGQQQEHKHEGEKVNAEVRTTKDRIEFRARDGSPDGKLVGYYDVPKGEWVFIGKVKLGSEDADSKVYGEADGKGKMDPKVFVNATEPAPPTELDTAP